jgi:hypothetical protein
MASNLCNRSPRQNQKYLGLQNFVSHLKYPLFRQVMLYNPPRKVPLCKHYAYTAPKLYSLGFVNQHVQKPEPSIPVLIFLFYISTPF